MKISDWFVEKKYLVGRRFLQYRRTVLFALMPRWVISEAMMKASRYIKPDEVVPEIEFMTIFKRVADDDSIPSIPTRQCSWRRLHPPHKYRTRAQQLVRCPGRTEVVVELPEEEEAT